MKLILCVGFFLNLFVGRNSVEAVSDPCNDRIHEHFPDYPGLRNEDCKIKTERCDKYIPSGRWFVFQDAVMLNHPPVGSFPSVRDDIVNRTICIKQASDVCSKTVEIRLKNCSDFYVYNLTPLPDCTSVYCFESSLPCIDPTTTKSTMSSSTYTSSSNTTPRRPKSPYDYRDLLIGILTAIGCLVVLGSAILGLKLWKSNRCPMRATKVMNNTPPPYSEVTKII
ncbi:UROM-like protein [Mya arenaria]|uniref:UROM-like protein n=1 Tax=Mya arenaria TaxID=6604 RepID=A0ABY7FEL8_MYAAR|nr:UROM-like protein [Mya arenaria]